MLLELRVRLLHHLLSGPRQLGPQPRDQLPLILDLRLPALALLADLRLDLRDQLALPCLDAPQLVGDALLQLLDVARPVGEPLLDALLHLRHLSSESRRRVALALEHVTPPLLGDTPLLFGEL